MKDTRIDPIEVGHAWTYDVTVLGYFPACSNGVFVSTTLSSAGARRQDGEEFLSSRCGSLVVVAANDNPFERYGLDPREGIAAITQRLKELAEDTTDPAERQRIRAAWEELTLHPARRLRAALHAHPETRAPLGSPPMLPRVRVSSPELELRDLAARPSAVAALPAEIAAAAQGTDPMAVDAPSLDEDTPF